MTEANLPLSFQSVEKSGLGCRFQHIFDEDSVAGGGVIDQHMGNSADKLAVLDDGAARHADVK